MCIFKAIYQYYMFDDIWERVLGFEDCEVETELEAYERCARMAYNETPVGYRLVRIEFISV